MKYSWIQGLLQLLSSLPPSLPTSLSLSLSLLVHVPLPPCPIFPGSQLSHDGTMAASNNYLIVYLLINPTRKRDSVFLTGQKSPAIESSWCQLVHNVLLEPRLSHMPTPMGTVPLKPHELRIGDGYFQGEIMVLLSEDISKNHRCLPQYFTQPDPFF